MKKYLLSAAFVLCVISIVVSCSSSRNTAKAPQEKPIAEVSGYTDIMQIPVEDLTCRTGGEGSSTCNIGPGIKIGDFITIGCAVSCKEGYYACCGVRCVCRPNK